jgi:hypothetical protein
VDECQPLLLGSNIRTATVVAREDCIVLSLHEKDFPRFNNIFGKGIEFFHPERLKRLLYKSGDMRTKVGRGGLTVSEPLLKAPMGSALETRI